MRTDMMSDPEYLESQRLTCKGCKKDLSASDDHDDICNECANERAWERAQEDGPTYRELAERQYWIQRNLK